MKEIEKNWMTGKSYCEVTSDDDGLLRFKGCYYLDGIAFSFSACEQKKGNHIIRGQVSVYSQSQGKLMRSRTKKDNGEPIMIQKNIYPSPPLGTDKSMWKYTVMMFVEKAAQSLLEKNRSLIKHDSELSVTPDSVSPQLALSLYGDEYMRCKHRNASNESREDYARLLSKAIRALPNEPMRKIKPDDVNRAIKERKLSKQAQRLTKEFWNYCIDSGRCNGTNPFPGETKRRKTAMAKQAEADRLDVLDDEMQSTVYQKVSIEPGGAACGIALMLWGGFDEKTACGFTWGDLRFEEDRTVVLYFREDNAGATHNYNRNLFPQGSEILQKRYEFLSKRYTAKKLKKMPIVSLNSTAEKTMRPDDLNKYGKALLQRLGIGVPQSGAAKSSTNSTAARIFVNTYIHNLSNCGLSEDEGLFRFLCGSSLAGNTTADHYRSFTDPDGLENQYSYLRRLAPEEPIILDNAIDKSDPDYDVYRFSAPTTQDLFCLQMELDGVETGQTVSLFSRYGGDIRVEAE